MMISNYLNFIRKNFKYSGLFFLSDSKNMLCKIHWLKYFILFVIILLLFVKIFYTMFTLVKIFYTIL